MYQAIIKFLHFEMYWSSYHTGYSDTLVHIERKDIYITDIEVLMTL